MTVNEFIDLLSDLQDRGNAVGDLQLRIAAFGGMRMGKDVVKVSLGFDWDNGALILHTAIPLTIRGPRQQGVACKHTSVHWRVNPHEPHVGRSVEVCNECGMSRGHWEQGHSDWSNADIEDFPPIVPTDAALSALAVLKAKQAGRKEQR